MVIVTPVNQYYTRSNQDCDELQAILCDLQKHPKEYLNHSDAEVRSSADWAMEYYKLRNIRPGIQEHKGYARDQLMRLYRRLRVLAMQQQADAHWIRMAAAQPPLV